MSLKEMLLGGGGLLIVLLTMVEIAPIKFNPWSALAKGIGRAINAEMLNELKAVKSELADPIRKDDEPATVLDRLKAYHEQTEPLVEFYRQRGKLVEVPDQGSIEATTAFLLKLLEA